MAKRNQQGQQRPFAHRSDAEAAFAQVPKEKRGGTDDLSIPPFLRREQPKQRQPADATKPNGGLPLQQDVPAPALRPTFANIPAELTALRNWVMWRYVQKPGKKKPDKVPFQPNERHAKTNDSSTWNTFDICRAAYNGGRFAGIGFVFDGKVGDDGLCYTGVDFDDCTEDGNLSEPARSRIKQLQTYTEISVSGTGVHCITRAHPGATATYKSINKGRSIEIYSKGRYFTFTGAPLGVACGAIRAGAAEVNALVQEVRAAKACQVDQKKAANHPAPVADERTKSYWFDKLTPEHKDEAVRYMLGPIAEKTKLFELGENGGNNDDYFNLITALGVSGAPHAEDYFVEFASKAKNADSDEALRRKFRTCAKNSNANKTQDDGLKKIKVGTLLYYARQAGVDLSPRALAERGWFIDSVIALNDPVIAEMNRRYSAGFIGGKFRVARFEQHPKYPLQRRVEFLTKDDFTNGVINPRVEVPKFNKKGKPDGTQMAPLGKYWFESSKRSEFDAVTFRPGAPPVIEKEQDGRIHKTLNTYAGFSVVPDHVDSAAKCSHYLAHIHDNIAGRDEELYKYILDWMASGVQHPEDPGRSALSLRGAPGCGKGVFVLSYGRLFGQHFLHATHREHVTGKFNAHQAETCLIFVDEALYAEIASDAQILKTMTSETTKLLERKGIDSIQIDNFSRLVFATNEEHPIQIEHDDRRYPAIYVKENESFANEPDPIAKAEKRKAYFAPIIEQLDNGGREALLGLLLDRDIRNFNAEAIPETAERKQQKLQSARAGDQLIIEFAQDGCLPGALNKRPWIARPHREFLHGPGGLLDEMKARGGQRVSRLSDHKLTDILKSWNFKRKSLGDSRGWEAPLLPELRAAILAKYPAVEFDDRTEWGIGEDGL
jgi:Family of unknown function (DUF5906)